jgi:hypothetical protein
MQRQSSTQNAVQVARDAYQDSVHALQRSLWGTGSFSTRPSCIPDVTALEQRDAGYEDPCVVWSNTSGQSDVNAGAGTASPREWHWTADLRTMPHHRESYTLPGPNDARNMLPPPTVEQLKSTLRSCTAVMQAFCTFMQAFVAVSTRTDLETGLEPLEATHFGGLVNVAIDAVRERAAMDPGLPQHVEGMRWTITSVLYDEGELILDTPDEVDGLIEFVV